VPLGGVRADAFEIAASGVLLDGSGEGTSESGEHCHGAGKGHDLNADVPVVSSDDVECFLASLGMAGQGPVSEPEPISLNGRVHDPARGDHVNRTDTYRGHDDHSRLESGTDGSDRGMRVAMSLPGPQRLLGP
jgi:hypothetical protein